MFMHNKGLQYTVRVGTTNPGLANLMLEQFGGPQGELAEMAKWLLEHVPETVTQFLGRSAADRDEAKT
nr:manganese catalase family protein [Paraburkholderia youngii]